MPASKTGRSEVLPMMILTIGFILLCFFAKIIKKDYKTTNFSVAELVETPNFAFDRLRHL
jgi:hypothetical protein